MVLRPLSKRTLMSFCVSHTVVLHPHLDPVLPGLPGKNQELGRAVADVEFFVLAHDGCGHILHSDTGCAQAINV